jgi:hypothetical protein
MTVIFLGILNIDFIRQLPRKVSAAAAVLFANFIRRLHHLFASIRYNN